MSLDKIQAQAIVPFFSIIIFYYFLTLAKKLKKILTPDFPLCSISILFLFFLTLLLNISCFPFSKFQGRSLNEQLPQQTLQCALANQPAGGTLVQDGWLPFLDRTNLCDKSVSTSLGPELPDLPFLPTFPVGNLSCWADSFQISIQSKNEVIFISPSIFFQGGRIQFTIKGGAVFGFYPLHKICYKYVLPRS